MLVLVQLDISTTEMVLFEEYEAQVLALLRNYGGSVVERLRSMDSKSEVHLLHFPDVTNFDAFRADPMRSALQELWLRCGASSSLTEVRRLELPQNR